MNETDKLLREIKRELEEINSFHNTMVASAVIFFLLMGIAQSCN